MAENEEKQKLDLASQSDWMRSRGRKSELKIMRELDAEYKKQEKKHVRLVD